MNTIEKFIALPLAIKVLQHDKQVFQSLKTHRIYESLIDTTIKNMQKDLANIGYQKVKRLDKTRYLINNEEVEFSPNKLRGMTSEVVREYFEKVNIHFKDKAWIN
ncbi:hypothetical protein [Virgibacillus doumboii]|uniref:hypothetical protein n=1 Tax=Virgibacillus doumboii TaxID=2697503 RepID=UPI0013DF72DB|nr:hypothetical protein [Virgibacillus doumboii]